VQPIDTRMILSAEQALLLGAIELLLGSPSTANAKPRRFTDIDMALGRHFLDRLLAQLSAIWTDVAELELRMQGLDMHLETAQMAPVSEPTLAMTMEARLEGISSTVALLLPWSAIAPVADRFSSRDDMMGTQRPEDAQSVRRAVSRVEMTVRAEVAAVELPIEEVLALREGDLLRLNAPAEAGVTLYADKVPVHQAKPGRSGSRRAVQITGRVGVER
jgi:flagellar motor switch protein FliM